MASDFGCEVLLCLSNPGGPTQYAACVPPITKLWQELAIGRSFPICSDGGVARTKVHGDSGSPSHRVTMTYTDGSQQTYSLAGISTPARTTAPGMLAGGAVQP
jgi:hypothetical protein